MAKRQQGGSVGSFVAFVTAMLMLVAPIKHLSEVAGPITRGLAALERGVALIEGTRGESGGSFDPGRSRGELELRDVSLRYPGEQSNALSEVSLHLRPGESVALVGPSGSGKSTLVNLLPRFLEANEGTVLLDGTPLRDWDVGALRRQFALVSQDVVLFNDTLAANVALGASPDDEKVRLALRAANLLDHAQGLPQGLQTRDRPQRQPALRRPAPAPGDRPRDLQGRAAPDPRRSHVGARFRVGASGAGRARTA